ncbi:uncharacterized protein LOC131949942 [Physella acuta]|uniref:uncharacterized protein LOC131949942 n=1 Tax=Physella acuta TaxID=109671 RepID=UPI0027DDEC62|nr:uncharacterized protein LOC131949942 [Physella acuta]
MKLSAVCLLLCITQVAFSQAPATCISKTAVEFDNNCYELFTTNKSWHEAKEYCSNFRAKRILAKVSSPSVLWFLNMLRSSKTQEFVWLGANDELQEGEWLWTDGTKANLTSMWFENEPNNFGGNENCLEMISNRKMNDANCFESHFFICMEVHDSNSPRPTVVNAEKANDKFEQSEKVAFTVGLSKPLDVLLKDVVVYNKVVSNVRDDYNNITGVFRCNIAGLYFFQIYGAANKGKELSLSFVKNKTKVVSLYSNTNQELSLADCKDRFHKIVFLSANSAVLLLEVGHEVFVEASNCGSLYGEEHHVINTFSGFLLKKAIKHFVSSK